MPKQLLLVFLFLLHLQLYAQPGMLDPTFNHTGITFTSFTQPCWYNAMAFEPGGSIISGGTIATEGGFQPLLMKFKKSGIPDSSFGTNGIASFPQGNIACMMVNDIVVEPNGSIYAAGASYDGNLMLLDFFVEKFTETGKPDSSFNGSGIVRAAFGLQPFSEGANVLVQPDGKVIITGYVYDAQYRSAFIASRYNSDGSIDNGFGNNGIARIEPGQNGDNRCKTATLQPDGKVLLAGCVDFDASPCTADFAFVRLTSKGIVDSSFGINGVSLIDNEGNTDLVTKIRLQPDGKIIACGTSSQGSNTPTYRSVLMRLNTNGTKDAGFGNNGIVSNLVNNLTSFLYDVAVQDDGKLVCSGSVYEDGMVFSGGRRSVMLARYNVNGSPDNSMGGCGVVITPLESNGNSEGIVAGLHNNRIYVAGSSYSPGFESRGFVAAFIEESNIVLPLAVVNLSASRNNTGTVLSWQVSSPENATRYIIQKSKDGVHFEDIGSVDPANSSVYTFNDSTDLSKDAYYRLQAVYASEKFIYSRIVRIPHNKADYSLQFYPNPAKDVIQVSLTSDARINMLQVVDMNGRILHQLKVQVPGGLTSFPLNVYQLPAGVYHLMLYSKEGLLQKKFVKM